MSQNFLFTSESVTEGHPDKVSDQISDAILDALLETDPDSRVACETLVTTGMVLVAGEITTKAYVNIPQIVRDTLNNIGYTRAKFGISDSNSAVLTSIDEQSPNIAQGVDESEDREQGAGDQGLMFGFACNETEELMPMPISIAKKLTARLTELRKNGTLPWLRPDGKSQVTVEYDGFTPLRVKKVVIATQHDDMLERFKSEKEEHAFISQLVEQQIIIPVLKELGLPFDEHFIVNGTGRFVLGGPQADTGLTGRKIIVDTYGGYARHGGGCFSGKDPSKVDRSASYMARYIAKNIVAAELADHCEVQLAYSIGVAEPVSFLVDTFGTSAVSNDKLVDAVNSIVSLKPNAIITKLNLKHTRYAELAASGHFGIPGYSWEETDMVDKLKAYFK